VINMKKVLLVLALIIALTVPMAGCGYGADGDIINQLKAWLEDYYENSEDEEDEEDEDTSGPVTLSLTYPAGRSPNVFTTGWIFGASCASGDKDYSEQVKWSGTGSFSPDIGSRSRPSFNSTGSNTITLSVKVGDKDYTKSFKVNAVSPEGYACVGMQAHCPADSHGCPADPLPVTGPITTGSSHVYVNGRPAARVGDVGVHAACAGPNTFRITGGDSSVLIDGRAAAKKGSTTSHCGGEGYIIKNQ